MTLHAQNVTVTLGRKEILHGVDITALPGQITAIVGHNGSGKSTFLKALTAEIPSTGSIRLNGALIEDHAPWELASMRAVLQQATTVAFPFTVMEIVQLGLSSGLSASDPTIPFQALDRVDLGGFANRFYHELSGGEQQRVQLARALAQVWHAENVDHPVWLFLDEPVSSLDIGHQFVVMQTMRDFAAKGGGVIAVMHDLNLTAMWADKVVLMQAGHVLASGTPTDVLNDDLLSRAYGCPVRVNVAAPKGVPFVLPQACA